MRDILNSYTTAELRKHISTYNKSLGAVKGYSKMKKAQLIDLMTKKENVNKFKSIKMKPKTERMKTEKKTTTTTTKTTSLLTPNEKEILKKLEEISKKGITIDGDKLEELRAKDKGKTAFEKYKKQVKKIMEESRKKDIEDAKKRNEKEKQIKAIKSQTSKKVLDINKNITNALDSNSKKTQLKVVKEEFEKLLKLNDTEFNSYVNLKNKEFRGGFKAFLNDYLSILFDKNKGILKLIEKIKKK